MSQNQQGSDFSRDLWTDPPGQRWEDFWHATDELVTVLQGEMEFEIAGRVVHPKAGGELLIPAGAVHLARNIGKNDGALVVRVQATGVGSLVHGSTGKR